jgi:hypothetical protein
MGSFVVRRRLSSSDKRMAETLQRKPFIPEAAVDVEPRSRDDGALQVRIGKNMNRGAQTAVFELDIRISNPPYIDVCQSLASEAGHKSRNGEKRINAV